jgi:hypothetical protein
MILARSIALSIILGGAKWSLAGRLEGAREGGRVMYCFISWASSY